MQGEFPTAGGLTMLPDVVAIGDNHVASVEARAEANKTAWAVRMGTWQRGSSFGRALGFARSKATAPVAVLWPGTHRVDVHDDYRKGIEALAHARTAG
jgi:DNA polymerase II small subunit/DNA polymerase delta subunit B